MSYKRTGKPRGRPKGTVLAGSLTVESRLKILAKIATNKNEKSTDRLSAVKLITEILNDKVRLEEVNGIAITQIAFDDKQNIKKPTENTENIHQDIKNNPDIITPITQDNSSSNIITDIIQPIEVADNKQVTEELTFDFKIEEDKSNE